MKKTNVAFLLVPVTIFLIVAGAAIGIFLDQPMFGKLPQGKRADRIARSPNAVAGEFRNKTSGPLLLQGVSRFRVYWEFFFGTYPRLAPVAPLPSVRTDLRGLPPDRDLLVWFGHSSVLLQMHGRRILLDPVFSPYAAPVSFSTRAFAGTTGYRPEDMPDIDYVLISHDHWDHLDYPTLRALRHRIGTIICPLGTGAHLERWGFAPERILEGDWGDSFTPEPGLAFHLTPARHFSGRDLRTNRTLWAGFVIESAERTVFYSGDSGYAPHFAELGRRFGGFDLAILECGQYDHAWPAVHMRPEESAAAARDLGAAALLPVHAGKFRIAFHPWDEPFHRISAAARDQGLRLLTPEIGAVVRLDDPEQTFTPWWEGRE